MTPRYVVEAATGRWTGPGGACGVRLGRAGVVPAETKREGDGATPLGPLAVRAVLLRPDRVPMRRGIALPWRWLRPDDGWSDDPADPAYNRPVCHPHPFSAERLWRDDATYDRIVVLGWNDDPPRPGWGSAIFLHAMPPGGRPTEGCLALDAEALDALLFAFVPGDRIEVRP